MPSASNRIVAAAIVATVAFWAYTQTLVPGVDLGDTGGFQAAVLWPESTARQAYPLYYALARPFVGATGLVNPARSLNLFSAIFGALAVGILVALTATIARSLAAGVIAGLLLAFSYTYWSQAIIAEVYTLHLALVGLCLLALYAYSVKPGTRRLAIFFAVYALAFGNHLSMILLLPAFTLGLMQSVPQRRELFRPAIVALALGIAALGALQYLPNLLTLWNAPKAPDGVGPKLAAFWFDVTMADWREAMVLGVSGGVTANRLGMWWFDVRQQFGIAGLAAAVVGFVALYRVRRPWALVLLIAWGISTAFALTYNVGDAHVFFLPAHYFTALFAGASVLLVSRRPRVAAVLTICLAGFAGWRAWDTWPAVDRHQDRRGEQFVARLATGISAPSTLLVTQLDWQLENVLLYYSRFVRPTLEWTRLADVTLTFPYLVDARQRLGRDVVLSADAAQTVAASFDTALPLVADPIPPAPTFAEIVAGIPRGVPYVLTLLSPPRGETLDPESIGRSLRALTGERVTAPSVERYWVVGGLAGEPPAYIRGESRPFRDRFDIGEEHFAVRMDSWLGTDTFRRAGFGHVLRGREHVLIAERGISLVWFRLDGEAAPPVYAAGLLANRPRYRIAPGAPQLASTEH